MEARPRAARTRALSVAIGLALAFAGCAAAPSGDPVRIETRNFGDAPLTVTLSLMGEAGLAFSRNATVPAHETLRVEARVSPGSYGVIWRFEGGTASALVDTRDCAGTSLAHTDVEGVPGSVMTSGTRVSCVSSRA